MLQLHIAITAVVLAAAGCALEPSVAGARQESSSRTVVAVAVRPGPAMCQLLASGEVECAGDNSRGQAANGEMLNDFVDPRYFSAPVPALTEDDEPLGGVTRFVDSQGSEICALAASGLMCWGDGVLRARPVSGR